MEFPDIGENCFQSDCKKLDFLPIRCSACSNLFCQQHFRAEQHACPNAHLIDNQVPACPLCAAPIPVSSNLSVDEAVSQHIDTACQSQPATQFKGKVFSNRCNMRGCKKREVIPIRCDSCQLNFCISHRHESDHDCSRRGASGGGGGAAAANARSKVSAIRQALQDNLKRQSNQRNAQLQQSANEQASRLQPSHLTDAEALKLALQQSANDGGQSAASKQRQEELDAQLAMQLQQQERGEASATQQPQQQTNNFSYPASSSSSNDNRSCNIS